MIKDHRPDISKITGKTTIIHKIRVRLNITALEYCLLELIENFNTSKESISTDSLWRKLGIEKEETLKLLSSLKEKGLIRKDNNSYPWVTEIWKEQFEVSDAEFEMFWIKNGQPCWGTSPKNDAKQKYKKARELYDANYLLKKRDEYFAFLELPENNFRKKMGCSVFLNVKSGNLEVEWKEEHKNAKKDKSEYQPDKPSL